MAIQIKLIFIASIIFMMIASPSISSNDNNSNVIKIKLQKILDNTIERSHAQGAVLLIDNGMKSWIIASGVANQETKRAMLPSDSFRLASMTKTYTAVTILKLIEEGKLKINDPISLYLKNKELFSIDNFRQITIRQLLNMTSGIRDYTEEDSFNDAVYDEPYKKWEAEELIENIYYKKSNFNPGIDWEYSNSNYLLLDMIASEVSGQSLSNQMRRFIFTPMQVGSTYMEFRESSSSNNSILSAQGYDDDINVTDVNDGIGYGDGGLVSNAEDVARFIRNLFSKQSILSDKSLEMMKDFHSSEEYGLGLEKRQTKFGEAWGHNGSSSGFQGDMLYFPKLDVVFVLLTNQMNSELSEFVLLDSLAIVTH